MEDIVAAAKLANAHNFISALPQGYDTQVLVEARNSALPSPVRCSATPAGRGHSESEKIVQAALDTARQGRTTLVVAHRLSTIRDADIRVVVGSLPQKRSPGREPAQQPSAKKRCSAGRVATPVTGDTKKGTSTGTPAHQQHKP
eukprot:TRINITY_DN1388_c0_g2_i5.p1 TRINITY_DN1388_c0_g2~~TRINITY_DN1388_c0_g2_i5.p1  ORF type:complete len:144 (+),score=21.68 TRINITY_DN1388_c0_g2_i5:136-567(+)